MLLLLILMVASCGKSKATVGKSKMWTKEETATSYSLGTSGRDMTDEISNDIAKQKAYYFGLAEGGYIEKLDNLNGEILNSAMEGAGSGKHLEIIEQLISEGGEIGLAIQGAAAGGHKELMLNLINNYGIELDKAMKVSYGIIGAVRGDRRDMLASLQTIGGGMELAIRESVRVKNYIMMHRLIDEYNISINVAVAEAAKQGNEELLSSLANRMDMDFRPAIFGAALGGQVSTLEKSLNLYLQNDQVTADEKQNAIQSAINGGLKSLNIEVLIFILDLATDRIVDVFDSVVAVNAVDVARALLQKYPNVLQGNGPIESALKYERGRILNMTLDQPNVDLDQAITKAIELNSNPIVLSDYILPRTNIDNEVDISVWEKVIIRSIELDRINVVNHFISKPFINNNNRIMETIILKAIAYNRIELLKILLINYTEALDIILSNIHLFSDRELLLTLLERTYVNASEVVLGVRMGEGAYDALAREIEERKQNKEKKTDNKRKPSSSDIEDSPKKQRRPSTNSNSTTPDQIL